MMYKKAQIGATLTIIPVAILVTFIMALFVFTSYSASIIKSEKIESQNMFSYGSEDLLLNVMEIGDRNVTIFEKVILSYYEDKQIFDDDFIGKIKKMMADDPRHKGKESCLYLVIDEYKESGKRIVSASDGSGNMKWFSLKKDSSENIFAFNTEFKGVIKEKVSEVKVVFPESKTLPTKAIVILSYYGGCS